MKKITTLFLLIGTCSWVNAQVLNQNAGWPNPSWTITGTYTATGLQSDPTLTANFAFDDDRTSTGSGQEDNIAAESPVINLTPAFTAGQTWLTVSAQYVYRYLADDELVFQYWNADTSTWMNWGTNFDTLGNYTTNSNYCSGTPSTYTSPTLSIAAFTPTQLAGFKYRISYDDNPAGADYNWGFCFQSPTIASSTPPACPTPTLLSAVAGSSSALLSWTENGSATLYNIEYGANGFTQGTGTLLSGVSNTYNLSPLTPNTAYSYYVQASCGGSGTSTWAGPKNFTTLFSPPANDECSGAIALTVNSDYACGTTTPGTVVGATASAVDATACFGTEDDDVWFSFVATATTHRISLLNIAGSVTDMYHSLWTGTCSGLTLVAGSCSDPNTSNPTGLVIGQTYYVRVNTYTATGGQDSTFNICIGTPPPPPPAPVNDECTGAIALTVNTDLACGTVTPGTIAGATASAVDATACFGTEDDDVWFSFVATATNHKISLLNVAGSVTDMYHSLWTGNCAGLTLVPGSCSDADSSNPTGLVIGQTYYVRVNTYSATGGQTTTFNICIGTNPLPPNNDECIGAIALTPGGVFADNAITTTNSGATLTNALTATCQANSVSNVWYTVVVPASGNVTIETQTSGTGGLTDSVVSAFTGTCGGTLTSIGCNDDGGPTGVNDLMSILPITGQTPGSLLYISVWRWGGGTGVNGAFAISAYDASLGNNSFDNANFTFYPNPVKNILNLSYNQEISTVEVFNLLGQKVNSNKINANSAQVDMSSLSKGAYMVKVTSNDKVKTIKVIKE